MSTMVPGASHLGFGFNIFGTNDLNACTSSVLNTGKSNEQFETLGKTFDVPENVAVMNQSSSQIAEKVFQSQSDFSKYLSGSMNLDANAFFFSMQFDAAFNVSKKTSNEYYFGWVHDQHPLWSVAIKKPEYSDAYLADYKNLPTTFDESNQNHFFAFFDKWGTHYVTEILMGGRLDLYVTIEKSTMSDEKDVSANMSYEYSGLFTSSHGEASAKMKEVSQKWRDNREVHLQVYGGDHHTELISAPEQSQNRHQAYNEWNESLINNPAPIKFVLRDIHSLILDERSEALQKASSIYTGASIQVTGSTHMEVQGGAPQALVYSQSMNANGHVIHPENNGVWEGKTIPYDTGEAFRKSHQWVGMAPKEWPVARTHVALFDKSNLDVRISRTYFYESLESDKVMNVYKNIADDLDVYTKGEYIAAISWVGVYEWVFPEPLQPWLTMMGVDMKQWYEVTSMLSTIYNVGTFGLLGTNFSDGSSDSKPAHYFNTTYALYKSYPDQPVTTGGENRFSLEMLIHPSRNYYVRGL